MAYQITILEGRDGKPIARHRSGKVILLSKDFPAAVQVGEDWEVDLLEKPRFFIAFPRRRIEYITASLLQEGEILVVTYSGSREVHRELLPLNNKDVVLGAWQVWHPTEKGEFELARSVEYKEQFAGWQKKRVRLEEIPAELREEALKKLGMIKENSGVFDKVLKRISNYPTEPVLPEINLTAYKIRVAVVYEGDGMRDDDDNLRYGEIVQYLVPPIFNYMIVTEYAISDISGLSWGQYCCDIGEACEDGSEVAIEIDKEVNKRIPANFCKVQFNVVDWTRGDHEKEIQLLQDQGWQIVNHSLKKLWISPKRIREWIGTFTEYIEEWVLKHGKEIEGVNLTRPLSPNYKFPNFQSDQSNSFAGDGDTGADFYYVATYETPWGNVRLVKDCVAYLESKAKKQNIEAIHQLPIIREWVNIHESITNTIVKYNEKNKSQLREKYWDEFRKWCQEVEESGEWQKNIRWEFDPHEGCFGNSISEFSDNGLNSLFTFWMRLKNNKKGV